MSKLMAVAAAAGGAGAAGLVCVHLARSYLGFPPELRRRSLLVPVSITGPRSLALVRRFVSSPNAPPDGVEVSAIGVPVEDGTTVTVLRHVAREHPAPAAGALLWLHGGGYVAGTAAVDITHCSRVAAELGIPVYSVDYRLAPEHPFPAALDDAYAALRWLAEHATEQGIDPGRIGVGGASAGGGLAAALCQRARDQGEVAPCLQVLRYPMLDDRTRSGRGWRRHTWTAASNRYGWRSYLGGLPGGEPPAYAAPARAADLAGLPPAWIGVGDADLFLDENRRYAAALEAAGVPVVLDVVPGMYHGADGMAADAPSMRAFAGREIAALREPLAG